MSVANEETGGRRAAVYRLWDAKGGLLYVGSSHDPKKRSMRHRAAP